MIFHSPPQKSSKTNKSHNKQPQLGGQQLPDMSMTMENILQLQSLIGNQAVIQHLNNTLPIQRVKKDATVAAREKVAKKQILTLLKARAKAYGIKISLIATNANATKLLHPLRIDTLKEVSEEEWQVHTENVYAVMADGADHVIESALHWREQIYPPDPDRANITKIEIEGSDLHERGLGTLFVTYKKPKDQAGLFPNQKSVKVVIKPEDRSIEQALFGDHDESLANRVNTLAGLEDDEQITTIKMRTHEEYGSLIEFVKGTAAEKFDGNQGYSAGLTEAMAFVMLTGMSDVHKENVIWKNGQPYFIDADNAMSQRIIDNSISQSGFSLYNTDQTTAVNDDLNSAEERGASNSKIMQAFLADAEPFIGAIAETFIGKVGRIVPLKTQTWADALKAYIPAEEGNPDDTYEQRVAAYNDIFETTTREERQQQGISYPTSTRWDYLQDYGTAVLNGYDADETGLVGEVGEHPDGGQFDVDAEKDQIKADFDQGKIPFYTYNYETGEVDHNGIPVYQGLPIDVILNGLLQKYNQENDIAEVDEVERVV